MKSTEFITEDINVEDVQKYVELIKQDCGPFLQQAKGEYLYRGLGTETDPFVGNSIRLKNRTPKDVPLLLHNNINKFFNKKFGSPFRNAMFCSGDIHFADFYGKIYVVFPIGKFEFLWSTDVDDLFMSWDEYDPSLSPDFKQLSQESQEIDFKDAIKTFLKDTKNTYINDNLAQAIKSNNEIMIRCERYYAVKLDIVQDPIYNFERLMNEK